MTPVEYRLNNVYTKKVLTIHPNVKVYIHGHGHSKYKEEVIEGVLCITNTVLMNTSYLEKSYSLNEWHDILKRY